MFLVFPPHERGHATKPFLFGSLAKCSRMQMKGVALSEYFSIVAAHGLKVSQSSLCPKVLFETSLDVPTMEQDVRF